MPKPQPAVRPSGSTEPVGPGAPGSANDVRPVRGMARLGRRAWRGQHVLRHRRVVRVVAAPVSRRTRGRPGKRYEAAAEVNDRSRGE